MLGPGERSILFLSALLLASPALGIGMSERSLLKTSALVMYGLLYNVADEYMVLGMQGTTLPCIYIYINTSTHQDYSTTTTPLSHHLILQKPVPTRVGHAHRPISAAATHHSHNPLTKPKTALQKLSTSAASGCGAVGFFSCVWLLTTTYRKLPVAWKRRGCTVAMFCRVTSFQDPRSETNDDDNDGTYFAVGLASSCPAVHSVSTLHGKDDIQAGGS